MEGSIEPFSLPLREPLETARDRVDEREGYLIHLQSGTSRGIGEATPLSDWTESRDECERALDDALDRLDANGVDTALDELDDHPAARHGLQLALSDLRSREVGSSLSEYLTDSRVETVRVNATVGDGSPSRSAERVRTAVDAGFDCVKLKVGSRSLAADRRRVATTRDVAGDDVELRVDANGSWSREEAAAALEWLGQYDVRYVEQPLSAKNLDGHAAIRGGSVGIALDEGLVAHETDAIFESEAADVLVLKPMALGGIDRARSLARRARSAGLEVVVTTTVDAVVARTAAVHLAASLAPLPACGLATASMLADDLADDPAPVRDGHVVVPDDPGIGVDPSTLTGVE